MASRSEPHTVRELIHAIQQEIRETDLLPDRAADLLRQAAALLGNCNDEIRAADYSYNLVLLRAFESEEKANRAKIRAETSPEYLRKREARDTRELLLEMLRSLKYFLRAKADELQYAGHQ